jgi:hypothetical protein
LELDLLFTEELCLRTPLSFFEELMSIMEAAYFFSSTLSFNLVDIFLLNDFR